MAHEQVIRKQLEVAKDYVAYLRQGGERHVVESTAGEIIDDLKDICKERESLSFSPSRRANFCMGEGADTASRVIQGGICGLAVRRVILTLKHTYMEEPPGMDSPLWSQQVLLNCDDFPKYVPDHHPLIVERALKEDHASAVIQGMISGASDRRVTTFLILAIEGDDEVARMMMEGGDTEILTS